MNWVEFTIECARISIAGNKKSLRVAYGLFILNAALSIWNGFNIYNGFVHLQWLTGIATGFTTVSAIWVWLSIWELRLDIKLDKERLVRLEGKRNEEITSHNEAKELYDKAFAEFYAKMSTKESVHFN